MVVFKWIKINLAALAIMGFSLSGYSFPLPSDDGLPAEIRDFIAKIDYGNIGANKPEVEYNAISENLIKVSVRWHIKDTLRQDDLQVILTPGFQPAFHWAPHLTPTDEYIIAQHVFRSPALIVSSPQKQLTIIPDLDLLKKGGPVDWYMDLNAIENKLVLGLSKSMLKEHVLYTRAPGAVYPRGKVEFGFYIITEENPEALFNPWRKAVSFFWDKWGRTLYDSGDYTEKVLEPYVAHTYNWAFNTWKKNVWQEFYLDGKKVGAPVFIVNVTQSPNYPKELNEREFRSIWNQAWFSSLRSAQGLYRYARRKHNPQLLEYALMTKELALSFPQRKGFFPGLIATEMEETEKDGKTLSRSKGWETFYFGNSNRNPYTSDPKKSPLHILDMSFTAWQMLTWYDELEKDERLLNYVTSYADALVELQDRDGFFPALLSVDSLEPLKQLSQSPETSMSVTFLLKQYEITKNEKYLDAALKAMQAVMENIIPAGRWEDFETYWSCSSYGADDLVNEKVKRNNMYKQNNFSMYWTAEALFNCYKATAEEKYMAFGQRTLDELLMTQATWQPPYMYIRTLGGFGVMNADGEWNDSRQSLFSELIVKYGKELNNTGYIQRGLAALRASFVLMYCPENPKARQQWESKWSFLGKEDYGFMMENYGHRGTTSPKGLGIGEFTIYDWGNGAASEAYNRMLDHWGEDFLHGN